MPGDFGSRRQAGTLGEGVDYKIAGIELVVTAGWVDFGVYGTSWACFEVCNTSRIIQSFSDATFSYTIFSTCNSVINMAMFTAFKVC